MTTNCSLFMKNVSSKYLQNMLCTQIVVFACLDIQNNFGTQHVLQMLRASEKDLPVSQIFSFCFGRLTLGPSKLENVADPGSGPRGPLPKIGVHYLNLNGAV